MPCLTHWHPLLTTTCMQVRIISILQHILYECEIQYTYQLAEPHPLLEHTPAEPHPLLEHTLYWSTPQLNHTLYWSIPQLNHTLYWTTPQLNHTLYWSTPTNQYLMYVFGVVLTTRTRITAGTITSTENTVVTTTGGLFSGALNSC